jgi:hypothetical protein
MKIRLIRWMLSGSLLAVVALPQVLAQESTRSEPPDLTNYYRAVLPQDYAPGGKPALPNRQPAGVPIFPNVYVADAVVNNTDPNLKNTDTFGDSEPSIAFNPATCIEPTVRPLLGCQEIILLAFSGGWAGQNTFAPLWFSNNGGTLWTKEFTIPVPPNVAGTSGCPCDQTPDFGRGNEMSATFLSSEPNVYSGTTTDPTNSNAWNWLLVGGVAQRTNQFGVNIADQPWLLVNRDPGNAFQNDVYVDYDDFSGSPNMRIAGSYGVDPPNFTNDKLEGFSTGFVNPGHRMATDLRNGAVYSLWQQCVANCGTNVKTISFFLNRSFDGGVTWGLNGSGTGVSVAQGDSVQPTPKFGTVNALLGGINHVAVDPKSGDVYVVYGNRDAGTGNVRLSIVRLTDDGMGGLKIGPSNYVTGQVTAALPSVAVASDSKGSVAVLYDTFDGIDQTGFPIFTAHLAMSSDKGVTFQDVKLETFLSPGVDNNNSRQRLLGDYQQLKSVGLGFYGVFTGNGVPFGRAISNNDPIFFKTFVNP